MQKFSAFLKELSEAAKNPLKINWTKSSNVWKGLFNIDENKFEIYINENNDYCENISVWEFKFTRNLSTEMIKDYKYPFIVVPTIQSAMEEFLKEKKPDVIGFVGNKDDKGRVKMYEKNAKIYSDKFKYKLFLDKSTDYYAFVLFSNLEFETCAKQLIADKE